MPPVKPCVNWNEASPAQASAVAATVALMVAIAKVSVYRVRQRDRVGAT